MRFLALFLLAGCPLLSDDDLGDLQDRDGDGYVGVSFGGDDCNDFDPDAFPGASIEAEHADDGNDQDCDGLEECFVDGDVDGAGGSELIAAADCTAPGVAPLSDDCDDDNADAYPGQIWAADCDGDGAASPTTTTACDPDLGTSPCSDGQTPDGGWLVGAGMDCDDESAARFPGSVWYPDCDNDGVHAIAGVVACDESEAETLGDCPGTTWDNEAGDDCDDNSGTEFPGQLWYGDCDGDGFMSEVAVLACDQEEFWVTSGCPAAPFAHTAGTDCDDSNADAYPGQLWAPDCDSDGGFDQIAVLACEPADVVDACGGLGAASWQVGAGTDCDDDSEHRFAGQQWFADCDGDTYHQSGAVIACDETEAELSTPCAGPTADWNPAAPLGPDCDDADPLVNPSQPEVYYDAVDDNCDPADDHDWDGDGYDCDPVVPGSVCPGSPPGGDDCFDEPNGLSPIAAELAYPGAPETWYDGVDQNCDGVDDFDQDGDGIPCDPASDLNTCPLSVGADCDDLDAAETTPGFFAIGDYTTDVQALMDQACEGTEYRLAGSALDPYDAVDFRGRDFILSAAGDTKMEGRTVFSGGETRAAVIRGIDLINDEAFVGDGGCLYVSPTSSPTLETFNINGCNATGNGGGAAIFGGALLDDIDLDGNDALGHGGGLYVDNPGAELIDVRASFGTAGGDGGGLYLASGTGEQLDMYFNEAGGSGGGIYVGAGLVVSDLIADRNSASVGGGIALEGGVTLETYSLVDENQATVSGGGIALLGSGCLIEVADILSNESPRGAGLDADGVDFAINGAYFLSNRDVNAGVGVVGGAMYLNNATATLSLVDLTTNSPPAIVASGGELSWTVGLMVAGGYSDPVVVTDGTLIHFDGLSASGYLGPVWNLDNVPAGSTLESIAGTANIAGVIDLSTDASVDLADVRLSGNGGVGINLDGTGMITATNIDVRDQVGTAVSVQSVLIDASNLLLANNQTGLLLDGVAPGSSVSNGTFVGSFGNALENLGGAMTITNAIFAFNNVGIETPNGPLLDNTAFWANSADYGFGGTPVAPPPGLNMRTEDPQFVTWSPTLDSAFLDLHLHPASLLIDVGDPGILDSDGGLSDLGWSGGPGGDASWFDDADLDGMPDGWEAFHGIIGNALADEDGDNLSNSAELAAGTWPLVMDTDGDGLPDDVDPLPLTP